jgi:hypothetical protein
MISYHFNDELQMLEVFYEGVIGISDLTSYGRSIFSDISLPRDLRILTDVTEATYNLKPDEIPLIIELTQQHIKPYNKVKVAFIQSKPLETALSYLLEMKFPPGKYKHSVFSTRRAAINWLLA